MDRPLIRSLKRIILSRFPMEGEVITPNTVLEYLKEKENTVIIAKKDDKGFWEIKSYDTSGNFTGVVHDRVFNCSEREAYLFAFQQLIKFPKELKSK